MAPIARSRPSSGGGERVSEAASCVGYVGCVDRPGRVGVRALVFVRWAGGFAHEGDGETAPAKPKTTPAPAQLPTEQ
jgi:hypothetical protein